MEKNRIISMALVLCMAIAILLAVGPIKVYAVSEQDAVSWMNNNNGKSLDYDGRYGRQCVDLSNYYLRDVFGITNPITAFPVTYAYQMFNYAAPSGFEKIAGNSSFKVGDLVIWNKGRFSGDNAGHVGVVFSVNGSDVTVFDQSSSRPAGKQSMTYKSFVLGVFRPKLTSAPVTQSSHSHSFNASGVCNSCGYSLKNVTADFYNKSIAIKSEKNKKYLSAWVESDYKKAPLQARTDAAGVWERFIVVKGADGYIGLKSAENRRYLSVGVSGDKPDKVQVYATSNKLQDREKFQIFSDGNIFYIKAKTNNKWLSVMDKVNSPAEAQGAAPSTWERFTIPSKDIKSMDYTAEEKEILSRNDWFNIDGKGYGYWHIQNELGVNGSAVALKALGYSIMRHDNRDSKLTCDDIYIDNMECSIGVKKLSNGRFHVIIAFQGTNGHSHDNGVLGERDAGSNLTTNNSSYPLKTYNQHSGYNEMAHKLAKDQRKIKVNIAGTKYDLGNLISMASNSGSVDFTIVGHSMGGAIAQSFAIYLMDECSVPLERISGRTFASALIVTGDNKYMERFTRSGAVKVKNWYNIAADTDSVPNGNVEGSIENFSGGNIGKTIWLVDPIPDKNLAEDMVGPVSVGTFVNKHRMPWYKELIEAVASAIANEAKTGATPIPQAPSQPKAPSSEDNLWFAGGYVYSNARTDVAIAYVPSRWCHVAVNFSTVNGRRHVVSNDKSDGYSLYGWVDASLLSESSQSTGSSPATSPPAAPPSQPPAISATPAPQPPSPPPSTNEPSTETENPPQLSGWARMEDMPVGTTLTERKWTYSINSTFESTESSVDGANRTGERWVQTGSGSVEYADFPDGFDKSHEIYGRYEKAALSGYENASSKREVTNSRSSYIYWHWTYEPGSPTSSVNNRYIQSYYGRGDGGYNYIYFHAVVSSNDYPYDASARAYKWNGGGIYWTWWWYRLDLNRSAYVDYTKYYTYTRTTEKESPTYPDEAGATNIQEWVKYTV